MSLNLLFRRTLLNHIKDGPSGAKKFKLTVFPVSKNHLMLFISDLIDKQVSMAVLNNVLYSISWVHQICDYDDPCKTSTVIRMKEGAKRILSKPAIKKHICCKKLYKCLVKMIKIL